MKAVLNMPKKRTTTKRKTRTKRQRPSQATSLAVFTEPSPTQSPEDRLRDWFDFKLNQLRERVDRLEGSSVGEFAALLDNLRQQVRSIETNELARVAEINRFGQSAHDAARSRVDDVVNSVAQKFVSYDYLHGWVSRLQQEMAELRELVEKAEAGR